MNKKIIKQIVDLRSEVSEHRYSSNYNLANQIREMLLIAYERRYYSNWDPYILRDKKAFAYEYGDNPYIFHFSELAAETFQTMIELKDDEFPQIFEYVSSLENGSEGIMCTASPVINDLAVGILKNREGASVLDLCAGYGLFLGKICEVNKKLTLKGYEIDVDKAHFANGYLKMCKLDAHVETADVFATEMKTKHGLVFSEFPFEVKKYNDVSYDSETIKPDKVKRTSTNWEFIYKALNSMTEDGTAVVVVPNGSLFRSPEESYRKAIIDKRLLEGVINLPVGSIPFTSVAVSLLIFSNNNDHVTFIDASDKYESASKRDKNILTDEILRMWESRNCLCPTKGVKSVNVKEIEGNDYYLDVNRYITKDEEIILKNPKALKDYAELVPGFQYTTRNYVEMEHGEGNVNVIKISNISDNEIDYKATASLDVDPEKVSRFILRNEDILVATKGTTIKAAMFRSRVDGIYIAQSNITVIRTKGNGLLPEFLLAYINGRTGRKLLEALQKGVAISSISMKDLENYEVPIVDEVLQYDLGCKYKDLKKEKRFLLASIASIDDEISSVCENYIKNKNC